MVNAIAVTSHTVRRDQGKSWQQKGEAPTRLCSPGLARVGSALRLAEERMETPEINQRDAAGAPLNHTSKKAWKGVLACKRPPLNLQR